MDEELVKTLIKRAKGYRYNEVQEEYAKDKEGGFVLTKRKVVKRYCPPDASALKTYMDIAREDNLSGMSDEELEREKKRLLANLKTSEGENSIDIRLAPLSVGSEKNKK